MGGCEWGAALGGFVSQAEETFAVQLEADGFPPFEREYRFHPDRKWRFDFAFVFPSFEVCRHNPEGGDLIAVEIEGGIWVKGAHTRGKHFESDCEKYNAAGRLGWQVYRFTPAMVEDGRAVAFMKEVLMGNE